MAEMAGTQTSGLVRRPRTGKQILAQLLLRTVAAIMVATVVAYLCDYLVLRYRIATNHQPFGTVTVRPFYAVARKDHRTEFMMGDPTDQQCSNTLFPQMGNMPCWYLKGHTNPQVNLF